MPFVKEGATVSKLVDGRDFLFLNISFEDIASWLVNRGPLRNKALIAGLITGKWVFTSPDHKALFISGGGTWR